MRRGSYKVQYVIVAKKEGQFMAFSKLVAAIRNQDHVVSVKLRSGNFHSFSAQVHADDQSIVMYSTTVPGLRAVLTERRNGTLRLKVG